VATPEEMAESMIRNLPEKTGKSLDQWIALLNGQSLDKHGDILRWLKTEHGMTHGFANLVSIKFREGDQPPAVDLVAAQYAGPKAALRPIHDALMDAVTGFGGDVELAPKKTYVSLRRAKQFGIVQASTRTRVDIGINLKGAEPTKRLEAAGSFNAMVSHRVRVASVDEVDDELIGWLRAAYEGAGK